MKLPNVNRAIVPEHKLTHYLLNPTHPVGGGKASFFLRFGFTPENWKTLADALLQHAQTNEVIETNSTRYGVRYVVDGVIISPDGTRLNIRSAWHMIPGSDAPRFVTAHPLPRI